jgi:hypothetical protein
MCKAAWVLGRVDIQGRKQVWRGRGAHTLLELVLFWKAAQDDATSEKLQLNYLVK